MKTFELFESKTLVKESPLYKVATKLCESMIDVLENDRVEYEGGIDFEPQPDVRGKQGKTGETGFGVHARKSAQEKLSLKRFAEQWNKLKQAYMKMRERDSHGASKMYKQLQHLHSMASKKGLTSLEMPPAPNE